MQLQKENTIIDDDLSKLSTFLKANFYSCVLLPAKQDGKVPFVQHKNGQYTWDKWDAKGVIHVRKGRDNVDGCLIRLSAGIIVIDVDCCEIAHTLEQQDLGFEQTVTCNTSKGRHYYFRRTDLCDSAGMYDGARQFGDLEIDIKTCNQAGKCPGMISVPPSPNKQWLRPPWDYEMLPMPERFIEFFLDKQTHKTHSNSLPPCYDINNHVPLDTLRNIVMHMLAPNRAAGYNDWLAVVFAINNICHESGHSNDERNQLIHDFSKRWPSKYDAQKVNYAIKALIPNPNGKRMGTIGAMAKADSPGAWNEFTEFTQSTSTETMSINYPSLAHDCILNKTDVSHAVDAIVAALEGDIDSNSFHMKAAYMDSSQRVLRIDANIQGNIESTITLDLESLEIKHDGVPKGFLHNKESNSIPIVTYDFMCFDRHFRPGMQWTTFRPCHENLKFTTNGEPRAQIDLVNYTNPAARSARINLPGINKYSTIVAQKKINMLLDAYSESVRHAVYKKLGLQHVLVVMDNRVQIQQNNQYMVRKEKDRHADEELIDNLLSNEPDFKNRWRFSPDVRSASCTGLLYCDPSTNIWEQVHNMFVEGTIVEALKSLQFITSDDRKYIQSRKGGTELRLMFARKVLQHRFHESLDENLDVFAVKNGLFDMRTKSFRQTQPEDMVMTHAIWDYDPGSATDKRHEVMKFLEEIFPIEHERRIFLCYMASLLSGRRTIKKFIVLTDRRAGNNGKSTIARLFRMFFSSYANASAKFVCKGSFDKDRDSHDAGLEPLKGKRILFAEELKKSMTLDVAMIKAYTGGAGEYVEGRKCGSGEWFKFVWQAGFILIFNENDTPKFDATDEAFLGRMIVAPMRSKFVPLDENGGYPEVSEEYTFLMDKDINNKFESWMPALADILLDHYNPDGLDHIPDSMKEWWSDITTSANIMNDWFETNLTVTGCKKDAIPLADLYKVMVASRNAHDGDEFYPIITKNAFEDMARNFCTSLISKGALFKPKHDLKGLDGKFRSVRKVLLGVQLVHDIINLD